MINPAVRALPVHQQRDLVVAEARRWIRTPYHHGAKVFGGGVDCATLIAAVYENVGLIDDVEIPKYGPQWHLHRRAEKYKDEVLKLAHQIPQEQAGPGDVVLYHIGLVKGHGGILTERGWPFIIHAYSRAGCVIEADGSGGDLAECETEFFSYW